MADYYTEVYKIQTKDGTLFDSPEQAESHIVDSVCEDVNEIFKLIDTYDLKHRDMLAIFEGLFGDVTKIQAIATILNKHLDF